MNTRRALQILTLISLIGTVLVGGWLRWWLAGLSLPLHDFAAIRHLHTHLGYYGVLIPLMWLAWQERGVPVIPPRLVGLYAAATLLSAAGFAREGYGLMAIVGSTVVLALWLVGAWRARAEVRPGGGWLSTAPIAIAIGAALVPLVARAADITRAGELVRTFLGVLLLGALLPTAMGRIQARSLSGLAWLIAVVAGAVSMGALLSPALSVGLLVIGVGVGAVAVRGKAPLDVRLSWLVASAGLAAVGGGLITLSHPVAVGGLHFIVLGPLLLSLWPWPIPAGVRGAILLVVAGMSTAILLGQSSASAALGTLAALLWIAVCAISHKSMTDHTLPAA
jgi:hypothetical protein